MKKSLAILVLCALSLTLFQSCQRGCGGWYGNRNLGYEEQPRTIEKEAQIRQILRHEKEEFLTD